jgi:Ca-activated chloride channel family protein
MRFLRPEVAWWLVAALAALAIVRWRARRRFAASTTVRWLAAPAYRASFLRRLPAAVLVVGLILTGCALMEPVLPYSESNVTSRGLDIVIVLDMSPSMLEQMAETRSVRTSSSGAIGAGNAGKTRLTATKDAIKPFVASRRDDRVALVVFSDNAYVISPLTFDHDYVLRYIDLVDELILREGMTSIGDGLALANHLLARESKGAERRNQVVVLFTDGENNHGRDPLEVLGESSAAHIRVHMVGVDLEEEVRNKPQVQRLFQSVRRYGGRYFNANTVRDLETASRTIDSIEKGVLTNKAYVRDAPVYQWFALPALLCVAAAIALRAIPFFIDYT